MKLHIVGLPHTEVMQAYNQCAYTAKVRKFCTMMTRQGYETYLYSSGRNEAEVTQHIQLFTPEEQQEQFAEYDWYQRCEWPGLDWNPELPYWKKFNRKAISALWEHADDKDILCFITGWPQQEIINAFPHHLRVEFGIGYEGVYAEHRVYESYAWMHCLYGKEGPSSMDGRFYDAVIPNFFEPSEFPAHTGSDQYYLFMSRMIPRKGYEIAIDLTERLNSELLVAGTGGDTPFHDHVIYFGYADTQQRGELIANAKALICPTLYLEPFGGVVVESLMAGTPVLTTDWGAFTETVRQGVDGFRCRNMKEFELAADKLDDLDHQEIRERAIATYSTDVVAKQYDDYFQRLYGLWGDGFYAKA